MAWQEWRAGRVPESTGAYLLYIPSPLSTPYLVSPLDAFPMKRAVLALLLLSTAGCELGEIEHTGTVTWVEQDHGFWGIVSHDDSTRFRPSNLPDVFEREGLVVEFEGYVLSEERQEGEWGIPVELSEVEIQIESRDD